MKYFFHTQSLYTQDKRTINDPERVFFLQNVFLTSTNLMQLQLQNWPFATENDNDEKNDIKVSPNLTFFCKSCMIFFRENIRSRDKAKSWLDENGFLFFSLSLNFVCEGFFFHFNSSLIGQGRFEIKRVRNSDIYGLLVIGSVIIVSWCKYRLPRGCN